MKTKIVLFTLASLASCQVESPVAPKQVILDYAQKVKTDTTASACQRACASIAESIPQTFYLKNEGDFKLWDQKQKDLIPACRIEPSTPEDVSVIIKAAAKDRCHFAIRSGGHSRIAGSSNAEDGITIDLRNFNQIKISGDRKTVEIGTGNTWGAVYHALEEENLMVVGGRVADVGVGGLLLGGGISFLSNRLGWGADRVTAFDIVRPDGSITTVTQDSDPDHFWALRGGGNNFGVVTAFHLELLDRTPNMWRAQALYTVDKLDALIDAQHDFIMNQQTKDLDAVDWLPFCYHQQHDFLMSYPTFVHMEHSDNTTWPAAFAKFQKIEPIPQTSIAEMKPMSAMTEDIEKMSPEGLRTVYKTITYRADPEVDRKILAEWWPILETFKVAEGLIPCVVLHPTPPGHTSHMSKNGGNPLGIAEEGPLTIMMTSITWKNKADDELITKANNELFDKATKIAKDAGKLVPYIYQNYAWEDQDVFAGYGEANKARLQKIQHKLDPEGVFAGGEGGLSKGYFKVNTIAADRSSASHGKDEL